MSDRPFTVRDSTLIEPVMDAVVCKAHIRWLADDDETVRSGTARHLVKSPDDFGFYPNDGDVRDAFLRVTLDSGIDTVVQVSRAMQLVAMGGFAIGN